MRYLLVAAVALFSCIANRSDASPIVCTSCPGISLSLTDAVTGKSLFSPYDPIWVASTFELLNFQFTTTFHAPATGIVDIGWPPIGGTPYVFGVGSPPFFQTTGISSQETVFGENFSFSGYFADPGFARIMTAVMDNNGESQVLGNYTNPGAVIAVYPSAPEPATWAMLLIGFAAIGFAGYRRQRFA